MFFSIIAAFAVASAQDEGACLVQKTGAVKKDATPMKGNSPFSLHQEQCIEDYVAQVKSVIPDYDLSARKFGGASRKFPSTATPPILAPGFGTTGTRSMCAFGKQVGLKVHHFTPGAFPNQVLHNVDALLEQNCTERGKLNDVDFLKIMLSPSKFYNVPVDMLMDVPIPELFLDWYAASPDSKVLLTTRNPKEWAIQRTLDHPNTILPIQSPCGGVFADFKPRDLGKLMQYHHTLVRCMVPSRNLLEVDIFQDDDTTYTTKIAEFLGRPQKRALPMPHDGCYRLT